MEMAHMKSCMVQMQMAGNTLNTGIVYFRYKGCINCVCGWCGEDMKMKDIYSRTPAYTCNTHTHHSMQSVRYRALKPSPWPDHHTVTLAHVGR